MQVSTAPTASQMMSFPPHQVTQFKNHNTTMGFHDNTTGSNYANDKKPPQLVQAAVPQEHGLTSLGGTVPKHAVPFNGLSFHNPFDVNSYPLTNPPLYDPTSIPYGPPGAMRRRRISISNGQIGQIVNHEAFYIDDDSVDEYYESSAPSLRAHHATHHAQSRNEAQDSTQAVGAGLPLIQPAPHNHATLNDAAVISTVTGDRNGGISSNGVSGTGSSVAGVPPQNHTLVYNNEVIYNPNDGPIPGTAAWKKERLLERNRAAASKCRQRKKHAQQQLQSSIAKYEKDLREKSSRLDKTEKLLEMYNSALHQHFEGSPTALEALRPFINQPLENIKFEP